MSTLHPLSIDEKRQVVYSSLLRYSSEVIPLRERVLDRVVLGALIGSSEVDPFRVGQIQENLRFGSSAPEIRTETVQSALARLGRQGKVETTELKQRHAYYLSNSAKEDLSKLIVSAEGLFNVVLNNMLKDSEINKDIGLAVCREFIFECFARYGQTIAKNVTGNISNETLMRSLDTKSAFAAAIEGKHLSSASIESLYARCQLFLRSSNPDDEKLKFYLTQGYYFAQLLGLEDRGFNPLNDHAFTGAVFYLDTNVLIVGILYIDDNAALFDEMIDVANRLGIELRVTRATIDEARRVAADRRATLEAILDVLPDEVVEHTDDQFLLAYLEAKQLDSSLTPAMFLQDFDELESTLRNRWKITVDDRTEDEIINDRDFGRVAAIMNEAAETTRGWGKSTTVLKHDVSHYALITDERVTNEKTWFLTRDRTLAQAAVTLAGTEGVFCFSLIGFLHSISPFLTSSAQENTFVEVFSAMLSDQVVLTEPIFEASELALMAEYHQDVMATPSDQLLRAFDYVKMKTLQGRPYRRADIPEVSLELRKFLSSSREAQMQALEVERARVQSEKDAEEGLRKAAEERTTERDSEITILKRTQELLQKKVDSVSGELADQQLARVRRRRTRNAVYMVLGFLGGAAIWHWNTELLSKANAQAPLLAQWPSLTIVTLRLIGALLFALPAFIFLRSTGFRNRSKVAASTVIILAALVFSRILDTEGLSTLANYTAIAAFLVTLAVAAGLITRDGKTDL